MDLKYIQPSVEDKHEFAFLPDGIANCSTTKWENTIVCYVYGIWPIYYQFKNYVQRVWRVEKKNFKWEVYSLGLFLLHLPTSNVVMNIHIHMSLATLFLRSWL